jgi:hypothetical protein
MTDLNFFQIADEQPGENPDYDETGCQCPPGDNQYLLELEEGQAVLRQTATGQLGRLPGVRDHAADPRHRRMGAEELHQLPIAV